MAYRLWLRYDQIEDQQLLITYRNTIQAVSLLGESATIDAIRHELKMGLSGLLGIDISFDNENANLIIGSFEQPQIKSLLSSKEMESIGQEGFLILSQKTKKTKASS